MSWHSAAISMRLAPVCSKGGSHYAAVNEQSSLELVLEGQEVFAQQMDPGRLQLTLQLVGKGISSLRQPPHCNSFQVLSSLVMMQRLLGAVV